MTFSLHWQSSSRIRNGDLVPRNSIISRDHRLCAGYVSTCVGHLSPVTWRNEGRVRRTYFRIPSMYSHEQLGLSSDSSRASRLPRLDVRTREQWTLFPWLSNNRCQDTVAGIRILSHPGSTLISALYTYTTYDTYTCKRIWFLRRWFPTNRKYKSNIVI